MTFNDEIRTEYLKITNKSNESEISEEVKKTIEQQGLFFQKNQSLFGQYKDMLSNYNYYTRERIQQFLNEAVKEEERFIFTSFTREDSRPESSGIIYPLLFTVRKNSKTETFLDLTENLFKYVIKYKGEMNAYQELNYKEGPDLYLEEVYYEIREQAKSHNIQRIETLEKLIIFEDFVGTGRSLVEKFLNKSSVLKQLVQLKELGIKIIFLILEISEKGEQKLKEFLKKNNFLDFIEYKVPKDTQSFKSYKGDYESLSSRLNIQDGRYSLRALVSTYIETPNNTISLFWSDKNDIWPPLFHRTDKNILFKNESIDRLQQILEQYDFRMAEGISIENVGVMKLSPKVNLMVLVLLKAFEMSVEWETARNTISNIFGISDYVSAEIISILEHADLITYNDDLSEILLTSHGDSIISTIPKNSKFSEFIDESVLC